MSLDDENRGAGVLVEEDSDREEELNARPQTCQTVKDEPEVSLVFCDRVSAAM
jgi:hypothetical protein